jgi:hypothetical protein
MSLIDAPRVSTAGVTVTEEDVKLAFVHSLMLVEDELDESGRYMFMSPPEFYDAVRCTPLCVCPE